MITPRWTAERPRPRRRTLGRVIAVAALLVTAAVAAMIALLPFAIHRSTPLRSGLMLPLLGVWREAAVVAVAAAALAVAIWAG